MGTLLILSVLGMTALAIGLACRDVDRRRGEASPTDYGSGGGGEGWNPDSGGGDCGGGGDGGGGGD